MFRSLLAWDRFRVLVVRRRFPFLEAAMKALTWHGKHDIRCESVPDPEIQDGRDAIIKVTACAICGSDLHLFNGIMPDMQRGDIMGHETMGRSWNSAKAIRNLRLVTGWWSPSRFPAASVFLSARVLFGV